MRHRNAGWKLGRKTDHRNALLRNLVTSLLEKERIITTVPKAKAIRPLAEKMITLGKAETLHARRQAASYLKSPDSVKKLFETIAVRFGSRGGGYVRITHMGFRKGDGADLAMVELIGSELKEIKPEGKKKKKKEADTPEEEKQKEVNKS